MFGVGGYLSANDATRGRGADLSQWLYNNWYCAMFSNALPSGTIASRMMLQEAIVLWRGKDGVAHALEDRCPHRYAPLSLGRQVGEDRIRCGYHGLEFDRTGRCVHNPHGKGRIPTSAALKVYPVHEYCGIVWLWMGTDAPDLGFLPDLAIFDVGSPFQVGEPNWLCLDVPFDLMVDNLMDLSHTALLHDGLLGNEESLTGETAFDLENDVVYAYRFMRDINPPEYFDLINKADGSRIDMWQDVSWQAPANVLLDVGCTSVGLSREQGTSVLAQHILTPVTQSRCMYHFLNARRNPPPRSIEETARIQARLAELRKMAFVNQDAPMVAAQYEVIKRQSSFRPNLLPGIDQGAVMWRRLYDKQVAGERMSNLDG